MANYRMYFESMLCYVGIQNLQPPKFEAKMPPKLQLSPQERDFFRIVHQAVLANPFSEERKQTDLKISGLFPEVSKSERIDRAIEEVRQKVLDYERHGKANLSHFSDEDQLILKSTFLFDFFHLFVDAFDQHITDQIKGGDKPIKVRFAREAFSYLTQKGFTHEEILHFFSLSFQLRRAYYFIERGLIGVSPCMRDLRRCLWNNVFTHNIALYNQFLWNRMEDFSTLILGETGTGKGTVAMAIGRSGFIPFDEAQSSFIESFTRSFTGLNLSQFPEALIESELFGHRKGAFTGAVESHEGVFQRCSPHGAIFLDEIGEVPPPIQIKLLKVLEERSFFPVGDHHGHRFEGRIIAATNRSLSEIRSKQLLREDFFYRLCSDIISVPPLRQRIEEDPQEFKDLLEHTLNKIIGHPSPEHARKVGHVITNTLGAHYSWPGNVRELGQCVRRILLNNAYPQPEIRSEDSPSQLARQVTDGSIDIQTLVKAYCYSLYETHGTFGEVARRTQLDRRTVKKYIVDWEKENVIYR